MWLNRTEEIRNKNDYLSYRKTFGENSDMKMTLWLSIIVVGILLLLFLPWTQTIQAPGIVTTRSPEQRPQEVNSIITGRIEKWFVKEGDIVKKGDTILKITETKDNYLDPELLKRTEDQIKSKEEGVAFYHDKIAAIDIQLSALSQARELKLQLLNNKIDQSILYRQNDSVALQASLLELGIAQSQFKRQEELYKSGLKSLTELEQRRQSLQNAESKNVIAENKFMNAKNDLVNARIDMKSADLEYREKVSKASSDKFSTLTEIAVGEGEIAKLKNQFSNYVIRNTFYFITAPQNGQITRTIKTGIGEFVKEGEKLLKIVPSKFQYAVEMYVKPADLPLVSINQKVRFQFDGSPAIIFTGWQHLSYGTFGGKVASIDNSISENGKFRILVVEEENGRKWPVALKVGGGAIGIALLSDVPIWYELWRNINGFPPDFYTVPIQKEQTNK